MFTALFIIAPTQKGPKCPPTDEWVNKCGTFKQQNIICHKKQQSTTYMHVISWMKLKNIMLKERS